MEEKISVIIPIYNTEHYLTRCVDSVLGQTYSNLEVILVDDGSTDNSGYICDLYQQKDKRVKVIHKKNEGQGVARNLALDYACGEYIAFVDSDDWIHPSMYEVLLRNLNDAGADLSCCSFFSCSVEPQENINEDICVFTHPEIMKFHFSGNNGLGQTPWNKLYKKSLFDDIRFPRIRAYEDCAIIYRVLEKCERVVFQNKSFYFYENRPNSTMTQPFSKIKFVAIDVYYDMYLHFCSKSKAYAKEAKKRLIGSIQYCIGETYARGNKEEYKDECEKTMRIVDSISYNDLCLKQKLTLFLIKNFSDIYGCLYRVLKNID